MVSIGWTKTQKAARRAVCRSDQLHCRKHAYMRLFLPLISYARRSGFLSPLKIFLLFYRIIKIIKKKMCIMYVLALYRRYYVGTCMWGIFSTSAYILMEISLLFVCIFRSSFYFFKHVKFLRSRFSLLRSFCSFPAFKLMYMYGCPFPLKLFPPTSLPVLFNPI